MLRFVAIPDADLTVEALRTALYGYLAARQRRSDWIVRIDDTDKHRIVPGKDTDIVRTLEHFALRYTRTYHQSERKRIHQSLAVRLLKENKAFVCTCIDNTGNADSSCRNGCDTRSIDADALKASGKPFCLRLRPCDDATFEDIHQGTQHLTCTHTLLLDAQGNPTSRFAAACDDMLDDIDMIVEDASARKRLSEEACIRRQLGGSENLRYALLPPLLDDDETPLAQHPEKNSLLALLKEGILPDALLHYLVSLGAFKTPQTPFALDEAVAWFDIEKIPQHPVRFDTNALRRINRIYLERLDARTLSRAIGFGDPALGELARYRLAQGASTLGELERFVRAFFTSVAPKDAEEEQMFQQLRKHIENAPFLRDYDTFAGWLSQQSGLPAERFEQPLKRLICGSEDIDLAAVYPYINAYLMEVIQ